MLDRSSTWRWLEVPQRSSDDTSNTVPPSADSPNSMQLSEMQPRLRGLGLALALAVNGTS